MMKRVTRRDAGPRRSGEHPWNGRLVRLRNGMPIEVDPGDTVGAEIARQGAWEWETCSFLEQWLKPGMTVIDAGAHVGQYAMLASGRVGPRGTVHAFEPHAGLYRVLLRNLERARCANVVTQRSALADTPGHRDLFPGPIGNVGATSFRPHDDGAPTQRVRVKVTTLDAYRCAHRVSRVDLIKIDVEGAELEVLDGGIHTLTANPDVMLVVEFARENARRFGHSVEDLASRLRALGFRLYTITPGGLVRYAPVGESIVNVVAVRRLDTLLHGLGAVTGARLLLRLADITPANGVPGRSRRSGGLITRRHPH